MKSAVIAILTFTLFSATAQHKYACNPDEVAFYGNDLMSYYDGKVVPGNVTFSLKHDGLNLRFASEENRKRFEANPQKYLPAYGGWCAIAIMNGSFVQPDFNHYKVQNGELLFFEVKAFFNGKTAWEKDPDINKIVADKKFNEMSKN